LIWIKFAISAAVIILAGTRLAGNARNITAFLGLGTIWGGIILLPLATSLPELVTCWRAGTIGVPDLALGNLLGSSLFNLSIVAFIDLVQGKGALLYRADPRHILTASLMIIILSIASVSINNPLPVYLGWVGVDTLLILLLYLGGSYLISRSRKDTKDDGEGGSPGRSAFYRSLLFFVVLGVIIVIAGVNLTDAANTIAVQTKLGNALVGSLLLAFSTTLPEIVTTYSAVRLGALDMALGNVFGASFMNLMLIFFADLFYREAALFSAVSQGHLISMSFVIAITAVAVFGLIYRTRRNIAYLGLDSIIIALAFILAYIYLYYFEVYL